MRAAGGRRAVGPPGHQRQGPSGRRRARVTWVAHFHIPTGERHSAESAAMPQTLWTLPGSFRVGSSVSTQAVQPCPLSRGQGRVSSWMPSQEESVSTTKRARTSGRTLTTRKLTVTALAAALGVSTLAACGGSDDSGSGAENSKVVTLVSHDSFAASPAVLKEFTKETGYTVHVLKSGDAGAALNQEILSKGSPAATSSSASTTPCCRGRSTTTSSRRTGRRAWTRSIPGYSSTRRSTGSPPSTAATSASTTTRSTSPTTRSPRPAASTT